MRRRLSIAVAAALGVVAMVAPGVAAASTLTSSTSEIDYNAAAGETNNLTVDLTGTNYVYTDTGATITPTAPCVTVTANKATCPVAAVFQTTINLGDLGDTATLEATTAFDTAQIDGGTGNDTMTTLSATRAEFLGDDGEDVMTGGPGSDRFIGEAGNDIATGNGEGDRFDDGPGNDTYVGGPGDDDFDPGSADGGADVYSGGEGQFDSIDFVSRPGGVSVTLDGVANDGDSCPGATCEDDNLTDIEQLRGSRGNDTIVGGPAAERFDGFDGADTIDGGAGDDEISGDDGDDTVSGGSGNDFVSGDEGADVTNGGAGDDFMSAEFNDDGSDSVSGGAGIDSIEAGGAAPLFISLDGTADDGISDGATESPKDNVQADMENVIAGTGNDVLIGNSSANELDAGGGNDSVVGAGGSDAIIGGDGDDVLDAGAGADSITGGAGSDSLSSRDSSADELDCGAANDSALVDQSDVAKASCEQISRGIVIAKSAQVGKSGKTAALKLTCPTAEGDACKAKVTLKANGKVIASGGGKIPSSKTDTVTLKLTDDGRNALNGKGKLKADASATFKDSNGAKVTTKRHVTLA